MEANGFKKRLELAKLNSEYIKLLFQYPASDRTIVKRGYVQSVSDDSFDFNEKIDGLVTYAYSYIVEIKIEDDKNEKS